jgi:hypothetical protein
MNWWQWALIAAWIGVAFAITVFVKSEPSSLAYRLTGDTFIGYIGRFFTALHWPLIVPIAIAVLAFEK